MILTLLSKRERSMPEPRADKIVEKFSACSLNSKLGPNVV